MTQRVESLDLLQQWEPNVPDAMYVADADGRGALSLCPQAHDVDRRRVVLRFDFPILVRLGSNDEGLATHPLYELGLDKLMWAGVVRDSELVTSQRTFWRIISWQPSLRAEPLHFVVPTKECLFEVLAENVDVLRVDGDAIQSASDAIR